MLNNFIANKNSDNAKLLVILTNRQRTKSVPNLRTNWPGKAQPNFALTARLTRTSVNRRSPSSIKILQKAKQGIVVKNYLPSVTLPLSGNLQLKPCLADAQQITRRAVSTSRKTLTFSSTRKSGVFKIQQNEDAKSVASLFRNKKIANKVSQIIDQQLNDPFKQNEFKQNQGQVLNKKAQGQVLNKKALICQKTGNERTKSTLNEREKSNRKEDKNKFQIDYLAFGYIEKIIGNPQLWEKYVHRIQKKQPNPYLTSA